MKTVRNAAVKMDMDSPAAVFWHQTTKVLLQRNIKIDTDLGIQSLFLGFTTTTNKIKTQPIRKLTKKKLRW